MFISIFFYFITRSSENRYALFGEVWTDSLRERATSKHVLVDHHHET